MSSRRGTIFAGRYRVIRWLGAGGTAAVFLACDERLQREVAVKRLHGAEVTAETAQRLQSEARIMAALRHPNVVTVYDMVTDEDDLLLAMEYVRGETLADVLLSAPLEPDRTLELLTPVAAALDYAHAKGVVHRDLKPSNVLVGASGEIKLADLGLATAAEITRITPPGAIVGTPAYMAPEQARAVPCTAAVDIYALATIAFQALSGRLPRAGRTVIAVLAQATRESPPDLGDFRPGTPPAAAQALIRGMSADPEARQASASGLVGELREAFAADARREPRRPEPAAAPPRARAPAPARGRAPAPVSPAPRGRRPNVRARLLALAALVVAVVAVIALVAPRGNGGGGRQPTASSGARATATPTRTATATPTRTATATATPAATARAPRAPSAAEAVRNFYGLAASGDYAGAWALAGPRMRAAFGSSFARFQTDMSSLRTIRFQRVAVTRQPDGSATVAIRSIATHTDRVDRCAGTLRTVRGAGGRWLVEPAGVSCTRG